VRGLRFCFAELIGVCVMSYLAGRIILLPEDRLFEPMRNLMVIVDALFTAVIAQKKGAGPNDRPRRGSTVIIECAQFPTWVRLPLGGPILAIANNEAAVTVELTFHKQKSSPTGKDLLEVNPLHKTLMDLVTPIFVDFFEQYKPWMLTHFNSDTKSWPTLLDFGRMVRNWISHHHGKVHFENPSYPGVEWHHLKYVPSDEGKLVIGSDLQLGDMIVLMFEISDELNRLDCPVT
jgi:hypothetical protein